ncbi:DUF5789 family protein [Halomarina oriensis]|uniref:Uncharacterized protein n=1 Tax=Halomarina oriensis TaxID=671145 RepID=A0A6B0GQ47_9EURY|nr:hypothetical protein [Halomarina oriensis]MWG35709.1 hypothetical protein [Halomarina oriensis]
MRARPPTDDIDDEPDNVAFGIAALDARLDRSDLAFPADTAAVREAVGDVAVPYDASGRTMTVGEALADVPDQEFSNEQALLNALHPVFEEARLTNRTGLVGRLRSLVPF